MSGRKALLETSLVLWLAAASLAEGRDDPADLCLKAAAEAASRSGVPYEVLRAIATVETGREGRPWPWTVNFGGDGHWFDSANEAEARVAKAVNQGATNIDVGCFQLNVRWHAKAFSSVSDMLDPMQNAFYAADYLATQFARTGDWALAAAAYHSATPEYATVYQARFEKAYAGLRPDHPDSPRIADPDLPARENRFPLLMAGATGANGSLVPAGDRGIRLIGAP